jgi:hypothetical protein
VATVQELSDPYANFMRNPLRPGDAGICRICLTFTDSQYDTCYACGHQSQYLDAVLPISYSVHFGQLHHALRSYKDGSPPIARRFELEIGAVLWRFLEDHENCLAEHLGVEFGVVTTVPSGSAERDRRHPLPRIASSIDPTRDRFKRLLTPSDIDAAPRTVNPDKFVSTEEIDDEAVLLLDDTWTTGANAQSAAAVLRSAGARTIGLVVIGRHVHDDFRDNRERLDELPRRFDWDACALE